MLKLTVVLLLVLTWTVPASGAIIIQVQNANVTAGGTGFVDVLISSNLASENLYSAGYDFQISGLQGNGSLIFRPSFDPLAPLNPANQTNSEQSVVAPVPYVFAADPDASNFFAVQDPSETRLIGGDAKFMLGDIVLTPTPVLLARLELQHVSGTPLAAVGDTFTISLVNDDLGTPLDVTDDSTLFRDSADVPLLFALGSDPSAFANSGTITITSAAVPEPGTMGFLAVLSTTYLVRRFRRTKKTDTNSLV